MDREDRAAAGDVMALWREGSRELAHPGRDGGGGTRMAREAPGMVMQIRWDIPAAGSPGTGVVRNGS